MENSSTLFPSLLDHLAESVLAKTAMDAMDYEDDFESTFITISGVRFKLGFFDLRDVDNLDGIASYAEKAITTLCNVDPLLRKIAKDFKELPPRTYDSSSSTLKRQQVELENVQFVDFAFQTIHILQKFNANEDNNGTSHQRTVNYRFKTPTSKQNAFDRQWKEHFDELVNFKALFKHCNASRTTKGYENLGNWLADQRRKLRRGKMTKEQYDMLTELEGVEWDRSHHFVAEEIKQRK